MKITEYVRFLLGRHTPRNATIITSALSAASKVLGYLRTLLVAYFFGASAFVDAYYIAYSAVAFLPGTAQGAVESAVIPKMIQSDEGTARDLMGWVVRALIIIFTVISILLLIFPEEYVRLFASTFDDERLLHAGNMVKWILPNVLASLGITTLSMWGHYKGQFTAPMAVMVLCNVIGIPALLFLHPIIGNYALPAFQSFSYSVMALCMWYVFRDMPLFPKCKLPIKLIKRVSKDIFYCLASSGSVFIYTIIDRYFASSLAAGNVAAISYAGLLFSQPMSLMGGAMSIYLVRASETAKTKEDSEEQLFRVLFMGWTYFFPAAVLFSALAEPVVKLLLGYGAFDARAVALTSPCLAVTALGLPIMVWLTILGRYVQAIGKLKLLAVWNYVGIIGNIFLDWLFVKPFGAPGLCAATSIMWGVSTLFFMIMLAPHIIKRLFRSLVLQTTLVAVWAIPLYYFAKDRTILPIATGAVLLVLHMIICEKLRLYNEIPNQWRPLNLVSVFYSRIRVWVKY